VQRPDVAPPFDQGVFLTHYNRGREAFSEGRYGEARRELEVAQRFRPEDTEVLNLLGLVYFKTDAFAEAEVIYRRLAGENPSVFILHSNLGLILFKQGKLEESEQFLLRAIELRPNYAKSHLYLGLLYKQKKKFGLALEHLRFAGAEKAVREVEGEMAGQPTQRQAVPRPRADTAVTQRVPIPTSPINTLPGAEPVPLAPPEDKVAKAAPSPSRIAPEPKAPSQTVEVTAPSPHISAARKLQEAVDEPSLVEDKRLDISNRIEGVSRTFTLHDNGFLEINFKRSVHVKRGTVSSYSGNLKFAAESGLLGTTAQTLVKAVGQGRIFVYEKGRKAFLLDLSDEFIYVEGSNLLALEDTLAYRVEPIYDTSYQRKIDTVKIFGKGSLAISTAIEPLTLRVTREYALSISSSALVAWTGNLIPSVIEDKQLADVMIEASSQSFKIRFDGDGVVVSEQ
jgi:uncharacterized protein (AIM24 family)